MGGGVNIRIGDETIGRVYGNNYEGEVVELDHEQECVCIEYSGGRN